MALAALERDQQQPRRLELRNIRMSDSRKTLIRDVFSGDTLLGEIRWYGPWRRYCFYPHGQTIFDRNCLLEIVEMLDLAMKERKEPLKWR